MKEFEYRARSPLYSQLLVRHLITSKVMSIPAKHCKKSIPRRHFTVIKCRTPVLIEQGVSSDQGVDLRFILYRNGVRKCILLLHRSYSLVLLQWFRLYQDAISFSVKH